jgi:hypothetical protein
VGTSLHAQTLHTPRAVLPPSRGLANLNLACTTACASLAMISGPPVPSCSAPTIQASPINTSTATVAITPPSNGGPWVAYELQLCPDPGSTGCQTFSCTAAQVDSCPLTGLDPDTQYRVVAVALDALDNKSPSSNTDTFTTPALL